MKFAEKTTQSFLLCCINIIDYNRLTFDTREHLTGSGVVEWARALTVDQTVNGSSPAAVKTFRFASELWQFRLPRLASVFRMRH